MGSWAATPPSHDESWRSMGPSSPDPPRQAHDSAEPDHDAIALRAHVLSCLPAAGSDSENWERARLELRAEHQLIAERAAEIAVSPRTRSDLDNWLLAEQEVDITIRMRHVKRTKDAYLEAYLRSVR